MGKWKASQSLDKLRKPVNKDKWSTEPAVVNAFYDPNKNDIGKSKVSVDVRNLAICVQFDSRQKSNSDTRMFSFSCRNPSAIVLQPILLKVTKLRWDRSGHWAWDHSRLRWQRWASNLLALSRVPSLIVISDFLLLSWRTLSFCVGVVWPTRHACLH